MPGRTRVPHAWDWDTSTPVVGRGTPAPDGGTPVWCTLSPARAGPGHPLTRSGLGYPPPHPTARTGVTEVTITPPPPTPRQDWAGPNPGTGCAVVFRRRTILFNNMNAILSNRLPLTVLTATCFFSLVTGFSKWPEYTFPKLPKQIATKYYACSRMTTQNICQNDRLDDMSVLETSFYFLSAKYTNEDLCCALSIIH